MIKISGNFNRVKESKGILFLLAGLYSAACKRSSESNIYEYTLSGLASNTTYYWKVVALDNKGGKTKSDIWSFTTGTE